MAPFSRPTSDSAPGAAEFFGWYEANIDYVWRTLRRLGIPAADLADLSHDVFVVAWKQRAEIDPERPVKPWLFGVTFRVAANHRRRGWFRWRHDHELDSLTAPGLDPEQHAQLRAELEQLDAALSELPLKLRAVLLLHDFDEASPKDIRAALGIPLQTVYSRLAAARKRFQQAFRKAAFGPKMIEGQALLGEQQ
ncbi:MAG TPA: sigma-70 family RNA polymerase sigma factor [Polyangiaceae bacterium]|jgi:RNA polymerase sigma-70 factor (ECF subfamily)|nr:sigma-70 family RNA polymerase sigma factor [Polyangiaceae bacterium]